MMAVTASAGGRWHVDGMSTSLDRVLELAARGDTVRHATWPFETQATSTGALLLTTSPRPAVTRAGAPVEPLSDRPPRRAIPTP
jgi:hypothetical protein